MQKKQSSIQHSSYDLENHGLKNLKKIHWNLPVSALYEKVLTSGEGRLADHGPIVVSTGQHTGRSANDKFVVKEQDTQDGIWWGKVNPPISEEHFNQLHQKMISFLENKEVYVQDCFAGADPQNRLPVRIISQYGWHSLFAKNMFLSATHDELKKHIPEFTVINAPLFKGNPETDGINSETFIIPNFKKKLILIGGTSYAGETKKSIFTAMNFLLPQKGILPMHCSANISPEGETTLFFGLSGTGKTTLSADASRTLIGDDEHGWSDDGTFNFEGGCYAKLIHLSPEAEPEIYSTTKNFGTVLENVIMDPDTREIDLDDDTLTENTRGSYPISAIPNASKSGIGGHPKTVIFLSCDAFGVLPPIARLTKEQAMYHFISGYTARVAGTERGVTEPSPAFSACYGAPFMPMHPMRYADLLGKKLDQHGAKVWLINTGWSGGPYGVGERMSIAYTRAMINAAMGGGLDNIKTEKEPFFGLHIPKHCPDVPDEILNPRNTWPNPHDYDVQAKKLANMFAENFQTFTNQTTQKVREAGPSL